MGNLNSKNCLSCTAEKLTDSCTHGDSSSINNNTKKGNDVFRNSNNMVTSIYNLNVKKNDINNNNNNNNSPISINSSPLPHHPPPLSSHNNNNNNVVDSPEYSVVTSSAASTISSLCLDDIGLPNKNPVLKPNYNSSSETYSSQLSVLREFDEDMDGYVDIPSSVANFIKPENARKNIMDMFDIIQPLGDGMSSCVFEVKYTLDRQKYALKRLRRTQKHCDLLFAGECKFLNVLKCKGVIRTVDAFVDENYFYVLNELGVTDLFKKIKANKRLSEQIAKEVIRYLLGTLKELHKNNMVHRDIKPENIVFTEAESNFPKLIDFGDALVVKDNKMYTELVGTQCYLAPERWRRHFGWELKAADIWAIGVLTYEMVTGKRCFHASSDRQLVKKIRKGHFKFPEHLRPSNLCCHFIRSLLTVESRHRPTAEFALHHPWLSACEDPQIQRSLIESWNANVTNVPDWTVYKPGHKTCK